MEQVYSNKLLNANYALLQGSASALFAGLFSNGVIYLMGQGINSKWVGVIFATANLLSVITQPLVARAVDQSKRWSVKQFIFCIAIPVALILLAMVLLQPGLWLLAVLFMISYASVSILTPLVSSIAFLFNSAGYDINYGVCRSMGSLFFGIVSALIGRLLLSFDEDIIIWVTIGIYLFFITMLWFLPVDQVSNKTDINISNGSFATELEEDQVLTKYYPHLLFIAVGSLFFFMFHNIINTYFYHIVLGVGGSEDQMGLALTIGAWVEIPMMLAYKSISQRYSHRQLLYFSGWAFLIKALIFLFATSMTGIYIGMLFQIVSFALYIIASVHYVSERVSNQFRTSGLALLTIGQTLGAMIGNLLGGFFIETFTVKWVLLISVIICVIGTICYYYGLYVKDTTA